MGASTVATPQPLIDQSGTATWLDSAQRTSEHHPHYTPPPFDRRGPECPARRGLASAALAVFRNEYRVLSWHILRRCGGQKRLPAAGRHLVAGGSWLSTARTVPSQHGKMGPFGPAADDQRGCRAKSVEGWKPCRIARRRE